LWHSNWVPWSSRFNLILIWIRLLPENKKGFLLKKALFV